MSLLPLFERTEVLGLPLKPIPGARLGMRTRIDKGRRGKFEEMEVLWQGVK